MSLLETAVADLSKQIGGLTQRIQGGFPPGGPPAPPTTPPSGSGGPGEVPSTGHHIGYHIELHEPLDREAKRDRFSRWISLSSSTAVSVLGPTILGKIWLGKFGIIAGLMASGFILVPLMRKGLVDVSEWRAFGTLDRFSGKIASYGAGLHPSHWWEKREAKNNVSLRTITRIFTITVPTKTAAVVVTVSYQFAGCLSRLPNYLGIRDGTTIDEGYRGVLESFLYDQFAGLDADQAISAVDDVNEKLAKEFMTLEHGETRHTPAIFEDKFGIITVSVVIKSVAMTPEVQQSRDAVAKAEKINEAVARLMGISVSDLAAKVKSGEIKPEDHDKLVKDALTLADNAHMNVDVIQTPNLVGQAFGMLQALGRR